MDPIISIQNSKMMHFQYIFNLMQRFKDCFRFYDIRNYDSFQAYHIKLATHISPEIPSITSFTIGQILHEKEVSRLRRCCIIIAYNSFHQAIAKQLKNVLKEIKCKEVHMLSHIDDFMSQYFFLCSNFRTFRILTFPNEIIPKFLYLGSQEHAHCHDVIEVLQITHVLNVTKNAPNIFPGIIYQRVFVEDSETEKISLFFQKAYDFIDSALDENMQGANNIVLVHCAKGVSRSATILIMFLMRSARLRLDEALSFVKKQRDIIEPNEGFLRELRDFDRRERKFVRRSSAVIPRHEIAKCLEEGIEQLALKQIKSKGSVQRKSLEGINLLS